jgi:hypothetical protein
VALVTPTGQTDATTIAILCQADKAGKTALAVSVPTTDALACTAGSEVTK